MGRMLGDMVDVTIIWMWFAQGFMCWRLGLWFGIVKRWGLEGGLQVTGGSTFRKD
jgi:hypothetical protein